MNKRRSAIGLCLVACALLASASSSRSVNAGEKMRLALVVSKDSPVNEISFHDLKRLYKGEAVNAAGKRLVPLNLAPLTTERAAFDKAVLGMDPEATARYWIDRKIRGQSGAPKTIEPASLVQRVVGRLDGAIGYVRANEVNADVKLVKVDGKVPNQAGYPIEQ